MNTDVRKKAKKQKLIFKKSFFKLVNNEVFGKTMKNEKKYRDAKIVTTERRRKEESIWCWDKIMIVQSFSQKFYYQ